MSIIRVSAKLDRTDSQTPWGFRMAGGKDYNSPLIIQKVNTGSLSSKCGIRESDSITHIGGVEVNHLTHKDAQDLIIGSGNSLELKLERSSGVGHTNSGSDGHFHQQQQHQQPPSVPWQQQQPYKSSNTAMFSLAPKPFQKTGALTTISSHVTNLNFGNSSPTSQGHYLPWTSNNNHGYGTSTHHHASVPRPPQSTGAAWRPQIPMGERKMKIGRPGQAQRRPPTAGSMRIPICASCHTAIRGPFITALDKTWCPEHFTCGNPNCAQPLFDCGFVEEADQLYCEKDYEKYLAPRCARCSGAIVGEVVNAMKNTYHVQCFVCSACHQPIASGSFHNEDGKIYCAKDWGALFQTKCYGCQFPIEPGDRWVEALSQNWHSECFNCSTCQMSLEGQTFCTKNGKPYCKKHGAPRNF